MANKSIIPWHQYAAISYIARKVPGTPPLGKTAMQKLVYLMQELSGVPIGYRFRIYNYGPYSSDLAEDLTYVEFLEGIKVDFDAVQNSYKITAAQKSEFLIEKSAEFFEEFGQGMDRIIDEFANRRARDLELISTEIFVSKMLESTQTYSVEAVAERVQEIKPKFRAEEIRNSIRELQDKKYVA